MTDNKSMEKRISGPEELDKILKKTNPLVWVILGIVILFLFNLFLWGFLATLEQKVSLPATVKDSKITLYANKSNADAIKEGQKAYIEDKTATVLSVADDGKIDISDVPIADGTYNCYIVIREIKPINFLLDE